MMRRRIRGSFGGKSGVWWRKHQRPSVGSYKSSDTVATSRMSLDSVVLSSSDVSVSSPSPEKDMFEKDDQEEKEPTSWEMPSSGSDDASATSISAFVDVNQARNIDSTTDVVELEENNSIHEGNVCISWDDDLSVERSTNSGSHKENDQDDDSDRASIRTTPEKAQVKSPQWTQLSKRKRQFGGKLRFMAQSKEPAPPSLDCQKQSVKADKSEAQGDAANGKATKKRKMKRKAADVMSPRTQKEVNYYQTRFAFVDREVKLTVECVGTKRLPRQPKRLNLS